MITGMHTPNRSSTRIATFDYAATAAYFVTIVTHHRARLFGQVVDGEMRLNQWGTLIDTEWRKLADRFPGVEVDIYVVMPNHFHGIICLPDPAQIVGARPDQPTPPDNLHRASPVDAKHAGSSGIPNSRTRARLPHGSIIPLTDSASPLVS